MGMYDELICEMPLPSTADVDSNMVYDVFQSKTTPNQTLDQFRIDEDGYLWEFKYDTVPGINGQSYESTNHRWEFCHHTGIITFTGYTKNSSTTFSAYFDNGVTDKISLIVENVRFIRYGSPVNTTVRFNVDTGAPFTTPNMDII